jgi:hypothetical protein
LDLTLFFPGRLDSIGPFLPQPFGSLKGYKAAHLLEKIQAADLEPGNERQL